MNKWISKTVEYAKLTEELNAMEAAGFEPMHVTGITNSHVNVVAKVIPVSIKVVTGADELVASVSQKKKGRK
jgi:hypothetical protein